MTEQTKVNYPSPIAINVNTGNNTNSNTVSLKQEVINEVKSMVTEMLPAVGKVAKGIYTDVKESMIDYAEYQDSDVKYDEIIKYLKKNMIDHEIDFVVLETRKLSKETLKKFLDTFDSATATEPDMDDIERARQDIKMSNCCFAKKINLDSFVKLTLPINATMKLI